MSIFEALENHLLDTVSVRFWSASDRFQHEKLMTCMKSRVGLFARRPISARGQRALSHSWIMPKFHVTPALQRWEEWRYFGQTSNMYVTPWYVWPILEQFMGECTQFFLTRIDHGSWGIFHMMKSLQSKQHKTNQKHKKNSCKPVGFRQNLQFDRGIKLIKHEFWACVLWKHPAPKNSQ